MSDPSPVPIVVPPGLQRHCIGCGQRDNHPRHVIGTADGGQILWHMDCHVIATGCETCKMQLAEANGVIGDKLREHLVSLEPKAFVTDVATGKVG